MLDKYYLPNGRLTKDCYRSKEWHKLRGHQLKHEPYCVMCAEMGIEERATTADHIKPHQGDEALFLDENNLQSLCTTHHNSTKHSEEVRGYELGCDVNGWPRDAGHYWNGGSPVYKEPVLDYQRGAKRYK